MLYSPTVMQIPKGERGIDLSQYAFRESPRIITAESLLADNQSFWARELNAQWEEKKEKGELWLEWGCGDARFILLYRNAYHLRTITSAGRRMPYRELLRNPATQAIGIGVHYDGEETKDHPGEPPRGCGGLGLKAALLRGEAIDTSNGVGQFAERHIWSEDPIIQALISASITARLSQKPVIAYAQDHLDGTLKVVATFLNGGIDTTSAVPWDLVLPGRYNPQRLYANGIPELPLERVPEDFEDYLKEKGILSNVLAQTYKGDLRGMQKVQNRVDLVVLSSSARPFRLKYPRTGERLGGKFQISLPRERIEGRKIRIRKEDMQDAINQLHYPISEHLKHHGKGELAFGNDFNLYIETEEWERGLELCAQLRELDWIQDWLQFPEHKIIVGQENDGVVEEIAELPRK